MEQLLLINPGRKVKKMAKKPRTAAQKRATAKMLAANRARRRASNPAPARAKTRTRTIVKYAENPKAPRRRRRNPVPKLTSHRRRRRNPAGPTGGIGDMLINAAWGAAGAVAVSAAENMLPLPAALKTETTKPVVTAALALSIGIFGKRLLGRKAVKMAEGALTVAMADLVKSMGGKMGLNLGYYAPAVSMEPNGPMRSMLPPPPQSTYANSIYDGIGLGEYVS